MKNSRIRHIDAWRCIAISIVVLYHIVIYSHPFYQENFPFIWHFQMYGLIGVQIFFCISGFVICRGMMKESEEYGQVSMRNFYLRRSYRILPPLFLYIAIVGMLAGLGVFDMPPSQFAQAALFLCNVETIGSCDWPLGHTWSLAYEEQFYLVFPLLFSAMALMAKRHRALLLVAAMGVACMVFYAQSWSRTGMYLENYLCMLAGCICALYWDRIAPRLHHLPLGIWIAAVVFVLGTGMMTLPHAIHIVKPVFMPLAICIAVFGTPMHRPAISRFFTHPGLVHVGRISYGIYLWQQLATVDYGFNSPYIALAMLAGVIVLAHFSYRYDPIWRPQYRQK
jgi:peptidoglycan/LPS O-acetylase OafA/YrhL